LLVLDNDPTKCFGIYTNDGGATCSIGLFRTGETSFIPVTTIYSTSTGWLDVDNLGVGAYKLRYGVTHSNPRFNMDIGTGTITVSGYDLEVDITVPASPVMNLIDVKNIVDTKQDWLHPADGGLYIDAFDKLNPRIGLHTQAPDISDTSIDDKHAAGAKSTAQLISAAASRERNRGSVVSAYADKAGYLLDTFTFSSGVGTGYSVGDTLQYPLDTQDVLFIVQTVSGSGGVLTVSNESNGFSTKAFTGSGLPLNTNGAGAGFVANIISKSGNGRKLMNIENPRVGDWATVLYDETHGSSPWVWQYADINQDGIANWISVSPAGGRERDFTVNNLTHAELGAGAVWQNNIVGTYETTLEKNTNKVTSINSSAVQRSDVKYPSEKAVGDVTDTLLPKEIFWGADVDRVGRLIDDEPGAFTLYKVNPLGTDNIGATLMTYRSSSVTTGATESLAETNIAVTRGIDGPGGTTSALYAGNYKISKDLHEFSITQQDSSGSGSLVLRFDTRGLLVEKQGLPWADFPQRFGLVPTMGNFLVDGGVQEYDIVGFKSTNSSTGADFHRLSRVTSLRSPAGASDTCIPTERAVSQIIDSINPAGKYLLIENPSTTTVDIARFKANANGGLEIYSGFDSSTLNPKQWFQSRALRLQNSGSYNNNGNGIDVRATSIEDQVLKRNGTDNDNYIEYSRKAKIDYQGFSWTVNDTTRASGSNTNLANSLRLYRQDFSYAPNGVTYYNVLHAGNAVDILNSLGAFVPQYAELSQFNSSLNVNNDGRYLSVIGIRSKSSETYSSRFNVGSELFGFNLNWNNSQTLDEVNYNQVVDNTGVLNEFTKTYRPDTHTTTRYTSGIKTISSVDVGNPSEIILQSNRDDILDGAVTTHGTTLMIDVGGAYVDYNPINSSWYGTRAELDAIDKKKGVVYHVTDEDVAPGNFMPTPDWDKRDDSINYFPSTSWTATAHGGASNEAVMDRTGFLLVYLNMSGLNLGCYGQYIVVTINGRDYECAGGYAATNVQLESGVYVYRHVIPVKQGDRLMISACNTNGQPIASVPSNQIYGHYIPPVFSEVVAPVQRDGMSYSFNEQLTGEKWFNGEPIYRRSFSITMPNSSPESKQVTLGYGCDRIVRSECVYIQNDGLSWPSNFFNTGNPSGGLTGQCIAWATTTGSIFCRASYFTGTVTAPYQGMTCVITLYYTKQ
jgi:hypothetical protein